MAKTKPSTANIIPGIFLWTSRYGIGKTSAALGCGAAPEKIYFVDADTKGLDTIKQMRNEGVEFGKYLNLVEIMTKNINEAYEAIWQIVEDVKKADGKYDAVIIDPINPIYKMFRKYVKANTTQFDSAKEWKKSRGSGFRFYEGKISGHARFEQERFLNELSSHVRTIQLTAHLKRKYDANVEVGEIPDVTSVVHRVTTCSVWLRSNPTHSTPIMLFIKPYGIKKYKEKKGIVTINVTPKKAIPSSKEMSVWDTINRYIADPAYDREPTAEEIPDEDDRWIIEQTLSKEQRLAWFARLRAADKAEQEFEDTLGELVNPLTEAVKVIVDSGIVAPPAIKVLLLEQIEEGSLEVNSSNVTIKNIAASL